MDGDTLVAIRLQLDELESARAYRGKRGKQLPGTKTDFDHALDDFASQLTSLNHAVADERLAVSIAKACATDSFAIRQAIDEERIAITDRNEALRLTQEEEKDNRNNRNKNRRDRGNNRNRNTPITLSARTTVDRWETDSLQSFQSSELKRRAQDEPIYIDSDGESDAGGPSVPYNKRQRIAEDFFNSKLPTIECGACYDKTLERDAVWSPCGHAYCRECVRSIVTRSITDESLYPPRCCREPIPKSTITELLSREELEAYEDAGVEYTTENRVYCTNRGCGKFIAPNRVMTNGAIRCKSCGTDVCVHCKSEFHNGDCPEDEGLQAVLRIGSGNSWRRCFGCRTMVELNTGCNHITCKCNAEFCYVCGIQWKNCACPNWDEQNLMQRAEDVVDREAGNQLPEAERQQRVQNMVQQVQGNVACQHEGRWDRIGGHPGRNHRQGWSCEVCHQVKRRFILVCRHCRLMACAECSRFRN